MPVDRLRRDEYKEHGIVFRKHIGFYETVAISIRAKHRVKYPLLLF